MQKLRLCNRAYTLVSMFNKGSSQLSKSLLGQARFEVAVMVKICLQSFPDNTDRKKCGYIQCKGIYLQWPNIL